MRLTESLIDISQIIFTLRAAQSPSSIPVSVASLNLITNTSGSFMRALFGIFNETGSLMEDIASVRRLYGLTLIPNKIANGTQPYPENQQSLAQGIAIEFRCVKAPNYRLAHLSNAKGTYLFDIRIQMLGLWRMCRSVWIQDSYA